VTTTTPSCRLCGSTAFEAVLDFGSLPIAHRMLERRDEEEERFPFSLHVCTVCGLTQILDPIDPEVLYKRYNYNFSSWKPEPHLANEIEAILEFGPVTSAIDIGCNDGLFLDRLREAGVGSVVGIEPNPYSSKIARDRGIDVYDAMISTGLCDEIVRRHGPFDLVISRQVIEHLTDLRLFFDCVGRLLAPGGFVFFDIPDFGPASRMGDCSVLWEEHVNYFTPVTFARTLEAFGLQIVKSLTYDFSGGTLGVLARLGPAIAPKTDSKTVEEALSFGTLVERYRTLAVAALERARNAGDAVVMYGSGVRSCMLLNGLGLGSGVEYAVDDQPERQGRFIPGARLTIYPSTKLAQEERRVVCVLAVNHENEAKVVARASALVPAGSTFVSACVPSDIWAEIERV
jgi:SAM-dependent methyltransferase